MAALIQFANGAPGIKYRIDKRMFTLGRNTADNDVSLPCAFVSKYHAIIEVLDNPAGDGYEYYLQDLDSTNHTYVNDNAVQRTQLQNGDIIRIGKARFRFDSHVDMALIESSELSIELPEMLMPSQSTAKFSRRLRTLDS